jgi:hypothetical protein
LVADRPWAVTAFFSLDWASQPSEVLETGRLLDLRWGGLTGWSGEAECRLLGEGKATPWEELRGGMKVGAADEWAEGSRARLDIVWWGERRRERGSWMSGWWLRFSPGAKSHQAQLWATVNT